METQNIHTESNTSETISRDTLISLYMEEVLNEGKVPSSVYKFCKDKNFTESEFYTFFGSFESLQMEIWNSFYSQTIELVNKDEGYQSFTNREKMLTFFYTFFEILTLNRSYILLALKENRDMLRNLKQLKGLRLNIREFAASLIEQRNEEKNLKVLKHSPSIFSEGAWFQTLYLLKFWKDDNSPSFEKTDIAIEKSVHAIFDVFDTNPFESIIDFGKFLWKENKF